MTYKELKTLASMPNFSSHIKKMCDDGTIIEWFPEAFWLDNFIHSDKHHPEGNPLDHTIRCLELADNHGYDAVSKIAVLFHDVGKTVTAIKYDKEKHPYHAFYDHEKQGLPIFECIANRLDIPEEDRNIIDFCIKKHMLSHKFQEMRKHKVARVASSPYFSYLKKVSYVDCESRDFNFREDDILKSFKYAEELAKEFSN